MYIKTMYKFKKEINIKVNRAKASEEIGVSRNYIKDILNRKRGCSLLIAKALTEYIDNTKDVSYFFDKT